MKLWVELQAELWKELLAELWAELWVELQAELWAESWAIADIFSKKLHRCTISNKNCSQNLQP